MKQPLRKGKWVDRVLTPMLKVGFYDAARYLNPQTLTVLNYHRIDDISRPGFDSFTPNVTATPEEFDRQMDYIQKHYSIITCYQLASWLRGECSLPSHAALITFDDGYTDNYLHAYPVLKSRKMTAVIFLTTDYIGQATPFYWDYVSYCFYHTEKKFAALPLVGSVAWAGEVERKRVMKQWIELAKQLPDAEKKDAVVKLSQALAVTVPEGAFSGLYLSWDQVREMSRNGIEMGSHTAGHPILTRVPLAEAERELAESKERIEAEVQKPVIALAYPNGGRSDYSPAIMDIAGKMGYQVAFSLGGGAIRYADVKKQPMAVRRIFLGASDTFPRFAAKLVLGNILPG